MGGIRWYKRDTDAALQGMMALTLEERGAYNTVLDLIYSNDGCVADDEKFIAGWLRVDVRVWRRIRARLLELEKLYLHNGTLRNSRADREVDAALHRVASARYAGLMSAAKSKVKSNENNDISSTAVERPLQPITTTSTSREDTESYTDSQASHQESLAVAKVGPATKKVAASKPRSQPQRQEALLEPDPSQDWPLFKPNEKFFQALAIEVPLYVPKDEALTEIRDVQAALVMRGQARKPKNASELLAAERMCIRWMKFRSNRQ